jgi:hypothetical protein
MADNEWVPPTDAVVENKSSEWTPPSDATPEVAKKKYTHFTIEFGRWYFRINGKSISLRSPIYVKNDIYSESGRED